MTTPNLAKKSSGRGPRLYAWPPQPPYELDDLISVTSAINAGLAKPFLTNWAAKVVAELAVEDHDIVARMLAKDDEQGAISHLKGAPYRTRQAAADRGTLVHAALESYIEGKRLTEDELKDQLKEAGVPTKLWKSTINMYGGLIDFMFDEEPEIFHSEQTVYSRKYHYAGTADGIGLVRIGGTRQPAVIDVKTSKAIYDETALQLTAYAYADFVGLDDGTEVPLVPEQYDRPQYGIVVRPKPGGGYERKTFALTPAVFDMFLGTLKVAQHQAADTLALARRP